MVIRGQLLHHHIMRHLDVHYPLNPANHRFGGLIVRLSTDKPLVKFHRLMPNLYVKATSAQFRESKGMPPDLIF